MLNKLIESKQTEIQIIIFQLGNEEYAIPITNIQEIITVREYTRIPESPDYIEGVINLRGNIIPIIDGRKKFSLKISEKSDSNEERIIIMDIEDGTAGLVVDNVSGVISLKVENIEPSPVDLGENNEIFWGIGKYEDKLFVLIDCQKGLCLNDEKQIKDFQNITEIVKKSKIKN